MMMLIWCWWWWWWWRWRWWRPRGRLSWISCGWSRYDFALWYLAEPACQKSQDWWKFMLSKGLLGTNRWRTKQQLRTLALQLTGWWRCCVLYLSYFFIDHKTYQIMLMVWSPYSHVLVDIKLYVMHLPVIFFGQGCLIVIWTAHLPPKKPLQNTSHALIF